MEFFKEMKRLQFTLSLSKMKKKTIHKHTPNRRKRNQPTLKLSVTGIRFVAVLLIRHIQWLLSNHDTNP